MKKAILYIAVIVSFCCSTNKSIHKNNENLQVDRSKEVHSDLTKEETVIINDFLDGELNKNMYKRYKGYELILIEEALKKSKTLYAYEFSYKEFFKREKDRNYWLLDTIQIQKLKLNIDLEKQYYWKLSDFKNLKLRLLKYEDHIKIINTSEYVKLSNRMIFFLSPPLIIDNENALISFDIGNGNLGYSEITHFTVLMSKLNGKWIAGPHFEDGVF